MTARRSILKYLFAVSAFISVLLIISCAQVKAQYPVKVQVQCIAPFSPQLSSYYTGTQAKLIVTLLNTDLQKPVLHVRLRFNIKGTTVSLRNRDYGYYPSVALDAGIPVQLSLDDLAPYFEMNNVEVSGLPKAQLQQNGQLPDGFYTICVEAVEVNSGQLVSDSKQGCAPPIWLSTSEPPILNLPRKGEAVAFREPLNIIFNWTPRHMGSPNAAFQTEYEFTLVEIWDTGILPDAAFGTMPPVYQTTTNATTLLYGPAEPPLLPGKQYAWRIRAKAKQGIDEYAIFRNNGYSEIFNFLLQEDCQPPQQVTAVEENGRITITWTPQPKMFEYIVEYREQGKDDAAWFNVKTTSSRAMIYDAVPGRRYEYRVGGFCTLNNKTLGDIHGFVVPSRDTSRNQRCGLLPDIKLANQTPIQALQPDDQIMAGDFPVRLLQVRGSGSFTGYGYITIPFLGYNRLKVRFDNITVNTDRQLIGGVIESTFNAMEDQVAGVDTVVNAVTDLASVVNDLAHLTIDKDYIAIKELADEIRKMAEEELPEELKDRIIEAVDNMEQAKEVYDEAEQAYKDAKTPEEKAAAKEQMNAAEKEFEDARKEVEAVTKEKEKLVKDATKIIIAAIRELRSASSSLEGKDAEYATEKQKLDAIAPVQGNVANNGNTGILIIRAENISVGAQDEPTFKDISAPVQNIRMLRNYKNFHKLIVAISNYYAEASDADVASDVALNGKKMVRDVLDGLYKKQSEEAIKARVKDYLFITICKISDQL